MVPSGPLPAIMSMNICGVPKRGRPKVMLLPRVTPMTKVAICCGSKLVLCGHISGSVVNCWPQTSASSVCALAALTLTAPCPHTVITRFLGFSGSGSMKVAQKSSPTPRTRRASSSESKAAFLRR